MSKGNFSLELSAKVWDDDHGCFIQVGPDSDGLDLVEMKQYNEDNKCTARMIMTKREALLLAEAINTLYNN